MTLERCSSCHCCASDCNIWLPILSDLWHVLMCQLVVSSCCSRGTGGHSQATPRARNSSGRRGSHELNSSSGSLSRMYSIATRHFSGVKDFMMPKQTGDLRRGIVEVCFSPNHLQYSRICLYPSEQITDFLWGSGFMVFFFVLLTYCGLCNRTCNSQWSSSLNECLILCEI